MQVIAAGEYRVNWNTGESMTVTTAGAYINDTISLTPGDAGSVEGLLGPDDGSPTTDLQLADGSVIPQPIASSLLYGAYADAWRITDATSLLNYGTNQTTATFTDTSFPSDVLALDQLPASVVAEAELLARQAGITDPNLIQAAAIDLLVTGDPNAVFASANVHSRGSTCMAPASAARRRCPVWASRRTARSRSSRGRGRWRWTSRST